MSKHTPGPWFVEAQNYKSSSFYIRGADKTGKPLTWGKGCVAHIPRSTVTPMEANARLIAAAPELLKLLTDFVTDFRVTTNDDIRAYVAEARAVIDKATGDES